ncbi:hypothetical protein NAEGRDRAFT_81889 [Naegleria gruberi]|uniref:Uncharacterized protein n=1 Tax=Naegleria gruberi TaxID=5762 RepID=D2W033_NAEGR|nr:uncharacterized protein NAEGRDRAFT_81889 [Naegleria gruberi]EFC37503.1 hypothetical protein NAEGRDRAFT_81889 [Naegleria gruberi]|eukprot:XP_002670247.1 hypothetical protein NAEGRDRAFT_81889 [Naegleria gruberi strain NEG-M]
MQQQQQTTSRKSTVSFQEESIECQDTPVLDRRMSLLAKAKRRVSLVLKKKSPQNATPDNDNHQQQEKITPRSDSNSTGNFDADSFYSNAGSTTSSSTLSNSFSSPRNERPRFSFASLFPTFTCPSGNTKKLEVSADFDKMKHERMLRVKYYEDQLEFKKVKSITNTSRDNFKNKLKSRKSFHTSTILNQPKQETISTNETNITTLIHRNSKKWNWTFYEIIQ